MKFSERMDKILELKWSKFSKQKQLQIVNKSINFVRYKSDIINYKRSDYWATPQEFLLYSGDCEDYCITKYFILLELGFDKNTLKFYHVILNKNKIHHMVLGYEDNNITYILDNNNSKIIPLLDRDDFKVYYSFNHEYLFSKKKKEKRTLKKWDNLLERMEREIK